MKTNKTFPKGFTIVELMVVIIIITIVTSIGTNTYQAQRRQVRYNDSVLKVVTMIKQARNYAVTSRAVYDECEVGNESYVPAEGYGVYIERGETPGQSRVVLFANTQIDDAIELNQFDEVLDPCDSDLIEDEYTLPLDTILNDLLTEISGPTPLDSNTNADENEAVIIFRPPLSDTTLAANDHPLTENQLTLPDDLYLEFRRAETPVGIPSQYVHINRIAGFPELE